MACGDQRSSALLENLDRDSSPKPTPHLLRYILGVATLAFTGRAAPLAFLPLVLKERFLQPDNVIGVVMAVYPLAALLTTPWASRRARACQRIVTLHSWAIIIVALAMLLTSVSELMLDSFGPRIGVLWVVLCRAVQGMGASFYLSSNTSLITRKFPNQLPYVIAMTEVAVGSGGQLGRLIGGFLYQFQGFACPFCVIAVVQVATGVLGFAFEENAAPEPFTQVERQDTANSLKIPWRELLTPRLCVGCLGAFMMYFVGCFGDATLLQYLTVHLAPVTVGTMSVAMSSRGLTYLIFSFLAAQVMHGQLISFERIITFGTLLSLVGQVLLGPQKVVSEWEAQYALQSTPSHSEIWCTQISAFVFESAGRALMFVPSLPLMQSEVRAHGDQAVEQVAEIFVTMMTLGEMTGPIFGGWLVGRIGFIDGTLVLTLTCLPLLILSIITYDHKVACSRRCQQNMNTPPEIRSGAESGVSLCGPTCAPYCGPPGMVTDGEAAFAIRRIPFALDVKRAVQNSRSLPGTPLGHREATDVTGIKPWSTAPSESFRRPYVSKQ